MKLKKGFPNGKPFFCLTTVATQLIVATKNSNLNIRKGPGAEQPLLGKAAHESTVTLLSKYNDAWFLVRTEEGLEGYASSEYLSHKC